MPSNIKRIKKSFVKLLMLIARRVATGDTSEESACFKTPRKKINSTRTSPVVTHPSTNLAWRCLTSQIGRDVVCQRNMVV